ncbi:hypothetical protein G9A89_015046 [Geosiphon pyriformis]|nr:hypothetical protein G9A89_015046 [Geosiphon pyriformis]
MDVKVEPVSFSTSGFSSILAELDTQSNNKKKAHIESIYSYGPLYKKSKNSKITSGMIDLLGGLILGDILQASNVECKVSWGSKVKSKYASISGVSDLENMNHMIAEEMSYVDSNEFKADVIVDDMTLRKTQMRIRLDWEVIIKEISVDFLRSAIESVFSKFGQSVLMDKNSVCVTLAVNNKKSWVVRNHYWTLLYTLPIGTTAHDLSDLLDLYGKKTCFIGCNPGLYVYDRYVVICFDNKTSKLAAIAGLSLACCTKCKQFGHISDMCLVGENSDVHLANIYKRKQASIVHPVADSLLSIKPLIMASNPLDNSGLADHMASLEHSIELLLVQVSEILRKLSFIELVPMLFPFCVFFLIVAFSLDSTLNSDMAVDSVVVPFSSSFLVIDNATPELNLSSSKVFITKVDGLESKIMALEVSVGLILFRFVSSFSISMIDLVWKIAMCNLKEKIHPWIVNKFSDVQVFISSLNSEYLGSGVVVIIDNSLARHVCKVSEVPGQLISIKLFFKNRLSVLILGLYAGVFSASTFIILGSDFNEDGSHKDVIKTIDYIFVSLNLVNAILCCNVLDVDKYFDTDYCAVSVSMGLGRLLDMQLNSFCKQANRDCWKFDIKSANKNAITANTAMFSDEFVTSKKYLDLNAMFHKLKVLVSKLAKAFYKVVSNRFFFFLKHWDSLDTDKVFVIQIFISSDADFNRIYSALFDVRKSYYASKLAEFLCAKESDIRSAIEK